jgi:ABC-type multidrug transport system fused ATPase/permease subunit
MDEQEQTLFDRFEKDTNHKSIMKLTEISAKISGFGMVGALILLSMDSGKIGTKAFTVALVLLFITLLFAVVEDVVRRRIQKRVNRVLGQ